MSARFSARLDPLSAQVQSTFGRILYRARQFDAAVERLNRATELEPRNGVSYGRLADVDALMGRYDEALRLYEQAAGQEAGRKTAYGVRIALTYARMAAVATPAGCFHVFRVVRLRCTRRSASKTPRSGCSFVTWTAVKTGIPSSKPIPTSTRFTPIVAGTNCFSACAWGITERPRGDRLPCSYARAADSGRPIQAALAVTRF
jgi:Tetratricopeptide repeat